MTCREAAEFLLDYLEGRLPLDVRATFDEHLGRCPPCVVFLASYRATVEVTAAAGSAPADESPEPVPEALITAILAACPARREGRPS
jgi:anti-sigma factor RsiW